MAAPELPQTKCSLGFLQIPCVYRVSEQKCAVHQPDACDAESDSGGMTDMLDFRMMGECRSAADQPFAGVAVFQVARLGFSQRKGCMSSGGENRLLDLFDAVGSGVGEVRKLPCQYLPR